MFEDCYAKYNVIRVYYENSVYSYRLVFLTTVRSQVVSSKQPIFGLTQELSSRISESTAGYTFTPCVGSFTFPGIDTR